MLGLFSNYNLQINFNVCNKLYGKIRRSWQHFPLNQWRRLLRYHSASRNIYYTRTSRLRTDER